MQSLFCFVFFCSFLLFSSVGKKRLAFTKRVRRRQPSAYERTHTEDSGVPPNTLLPGFHALYPRPSSPFAVDGTISNFDASPLFSFHKFTDENFATTQAPRAGAFNDRYPSGIPRGDPIPPEMPLIRYRSSDISTFRNPLEELGWSKDGNKPVFDNPEG